MILGGVAVCFLFNLLLSAHRAVIFAIVQLSCNTSYLSYDILTSSGLQSVIELNAQKDNEIHLQRDKCWRFWGNRESLNMDRALSSLPLSYGND